MQILALGDSYTIGEGVDADASWPMQLTAALRESGIDMQPPRIVARTGWTTSELQQGIIRANLNAAYDLVTLLIGVNNQYRGQDPQRFADEFDSLLRTAIQFAAGRPQAVLALSIPAYGETPFAITVQLDAVRISSELEYLNGIATALSQKLGVHWIDVAMRFHVAQHERNMLAKDGLHPSGEMYALWVEEILPVAIQALKAPRGER